MAYRSIAEFAKVMVVTIGDMELETTISVMVMYRIKSSLENSSDTAKEME